MAQIKKDPFAEIGLFLVAYLGLTGSGKSLSAVENHVLPALVRGLTVYSNTWVNWNGPNLKYFSSWEDLHDVRNSIIFIDEIGDYLDPLSFKDFSKEDKNVIRYHRKRGNTLVFTAQDLSDLAKQVRVKTHRFILCEAEPDGPIVKWFLKNILGYERVCFNTLMLTFKDLKKLSLGVGSPAIVSQNEEEEEGSFSEDISDIKDNLSLSKDVPVPEKVRFKIKTLLHNELNDKKVNYFGHSCEECRAYKLKTDNDADLPISCPVHTDILMTLRPLSMYDTNAELKVKSEDYVIKKFKVVSKRSLVQV